MDRPCFLDENVIPCILDGKHSCTYGKSWYGCGFGNRSDSLAKYKNRLIIKARSMREEIEKEYGRLIRHTNAGLKKHITQIIKKHL